MVTIQNETTEKPITLIGKEAGVCYGSDINDNEKNYQRGLSCIKSNHGRTLEYPQVYMVITGYSARVIRELYTHIAGAPTRLQSSTRYIKYGNFNYITPPSIAKDEYANEVYENVMYQISEAYKDLEQVGIPNEDISNVLPLGMTTKVVVRTNLRNLVDMSHTRLCTRSYWEYRKLMNEIMEELSSYSREWAEVVNMMFVPKCDITKTCEEEKSCGRYGKSS